MDLTVTHTERADEATRGFSEQRGPERPARRRRGSLLPYLLISPAVILFVLVIAYPFVGSLAFGLTNQSLIGNDVSWAGLDNIAVLIGDPTFWDVVGHTAVFVVTSTLGAFVLALALAMALNTRIRGRGLIRTTMLLPWIVPGVVVSFVWAWIFDTNYGLLNGIIHLTNLGPGDVNWLDDPVLAMTAVVIAKIWHSFPWMMVLILAALQGVPSEVHDAAAVDGASGWKKQAYVILPQIKPALALTLLLETIWGLQHFEIPWVMTSGGPVGSTTTLSIALYKEAFQSFDLGMAGAIGILWTGVMTIVVAAYVFYSSRQERRNA